MSDEKRKIYPKKPTGTVPKAKYRNNSQVNHDGGQNVASNNLVHYGDERDCYQSKLKFYGNPEFLKRNFLLPQGFAMDNASEETRSSPKQNGSMYPFNGGANGTSSTPSTSASVSRRNSTSTAPKSDNVTKYPDKKHIEERLSKIRDYLNATSCLITNMKSGDHSNEEELESFNQMYKDLKDSESKLLAMLMAIQIQEDEEAKAAENGIETLDKAELERRYDQANREVQQLQEQENLLLSLQLAAESQLRDARNAQQKLYVTKGTNQARNSKMESLAEGVIQEPTEHQAVTSKNSNEMYFESVRAIDDHIKQLGERPMGGNVNENVQNQIENLQQHIGLLRDSNENRSHLIQILDNRDAALKLEHLELQGRLLELQNKKSQVDHLVSQLQSLNDDSEDEDVGAQVRRIVNMKDQLTKLKDMLDAVKSTETMLETQNINESDVDLQENSKSDNLRRTGNSSVRVENASNRSANMRKEKQVNKSSIKSNEREKLKLQEELQAKKRELEELMYKHKAVSSNLNQDVHVENKNDHFNTQFDSDVEWRPIPNTYNVPSSDSEDCPEEDVNEYSEFNSSADTNNTSLLQPMPSLNYPTSNYIKHRETDVRSARSVPSPRNTSKTPERVARGPSVAASLHHDRTVSNSEQDLTKTQMQKKLELIRSVCDSMLANGGQENIHQLRNNLTPSPLYSEPRQFETPNSQIRNALSTVIPGPDQTWIPASVPSYAPPEMANYQNFLATNTLQTQAFMLNTLNQCCQMMWLQQRELASLRNTVSLMLDRYPLDQNLQSTYMNTTPSFPISTNIPDPRPQQTSRLSKSNQVSSATSLPNLSHMQVPHTNLEPPACSNNAQNARPMESNLNNSAVHSHQNDIGEHANNLPLPSQIWNGQALNNQVAPGNRANNYWDNFRSYSRQNLLSTKSNDGSQNAVDRSQTTSLPMGPIKLNSEYQESVENTPRRRTCFKTIRTNSGEHIDIVHNIPPDVLNINQHQKGNENHDLFEIQPSINEENASAMEENACRHNTMQSNVHHEEVQKELFNYRQNRYRNYWQNNQDGTKSLHSLYNSELRENIFRGVANLIATNEERPHFLIQLLRGLQKVRSDQMRCQTLQSLQSLFSSHDESLDTRQEQNDGENLYSDYREVLSRLWPQSPKNCDNDSLNSIALDIDYMLSEVLLFLNANSEEAFQFEIVDTIKDILIQSRLTTIPKDEVIQRYFASLLECSVAVYRGKLIKDVKVNILKAIEDLLKMDLRKFVREDHETGESTDEDDNLVANNLVGPFELNEQESILEDVNPPQIENGDLAEADQSRLELEDEDEEGAVGGVINIFVERCPNPTQNTSDDVDISKIEFSIDKEDGEYSEQGLDRVPTRLTITKSRSNTPNKDCCPRSDVAEQF